MSADRNLLFGILAVQLDFVTREHLFIAMNAWVLAKHRPIGEILVEQKALPQAKRDLLEPLVDQHVKDHGNDAQKSLAAVSSASSIREQLRDVPDADVQASLGFFGIDYEATRSHAPLPSDDSSGSRYRILRPHARGGLGEVFVARDTELNREVALKEIQTGKDRGDNRARFVLEAEITGGLEHPGIVPVYGLGHYADGRPYYAMRFIKGDNLGEAIKRFHSLASVEASARRGVESQDHVGLTARRSPDFDSLEFRRLLQRFIDVCNAVAYAHSRGVLHRDLKPGNIMLGKYGETLVVDWGLAKIAGRKSDNVTADNEDTLQPLSGSDVIPTQHGSTIGSPAYMSPEQAEGKLDQLGPASDVYSLGATLYHLLVGKPANADCEVMEVLIRCQKGEIPAPLSINSAIPKSLNAICMKAMAMKRTERYVTSQDLAADVEHWLADEAVLAWQEPFTHHARRWMRKHRTFATSASFVGITAIICLVIGIAAVERQRENVVAQAKQTAHQRDRAIAARNTTRQALDDMVSAVARESLASQIAISAEQKKFLETVVKYYEEFASEPGEDREGLLRLAKAHYRIGDIRQRLGQIPEGVEMYRRAADYFSAIANDFPNVPEYRAGLAASQFSVAHLLSALNRPEAEDACRDAIKSWQGLSDDFPAIANYRNGLADSQNNLGVVLADKHRYADADEAYRARIEILQKLIDDFPAESKYWESLAQSYDNLGAMYHNLGDLTKAERPYLEAVAVRQKLTDEFPAVTEYTKSLAEAQTNLGNLFRRQEKRRDAELAYRAALNLGQILADRFPAVPDYRRMIARIHNSMGVLFVDSGKLTDALTSYQSATLVQQRLARESPTVPEYQEMVARTNHNLGNLFVELRQFSQADSCYRDALAVRAKLAANFPDVPNYQKSLAATHNALGTCFDELGDRTAAKEAFLASLALRKKLVERFPADAEYRIELGSSYCNIGVYFYLTDDSASALDWFENAIQTLDEIHQKEKSDKDARYLLCDSFIGRAKVQDRLKRQAQARQDWDRAMELDNGSRQLDIRAGRAANTARTGDLVTAIAEAHKLVAREDTMADDHYTIAYVFSLCVSLATDRKDECADKAMDHLRQAVAAGYKNVEHMKKDKDLDALREREDFKKLLADLEAKVVAEKKPADKSNEKKE